MAAKTKQESEHDVTFAKGGTTKMFSQQAAEPMEPGTTRDKSATDTAPGPKFASGGSHKMFSFNPSQPATAGQTGAR
jgi:hypothetical protein